MKSLKILILNLSLLSAILVVGSSCGGDDPAPAPPPPPPTKSELIVQNWRLTSVSLNGQAATVSQFSIKFQANKSFTFDTPTVPGLPQTGTWALNSTETVIILNGTVELPIETLTASRFVFKYTYKNHKEGNVEVRFGMDK